MQAGESTRERPSRGRFLVGNEQMGAGRGGGMSEQREISFHSMDVPMFT